MKIFELFDEDGSGEITFRNLKRVAVRSQRVVMCCILRFAADMTFNIETGGAWRKFNRRRDARND